MEDILPELLDFIAANVATVDQLRILLLLQQNPERTWNAMSITAVLQVQQEAARACLDRLHRSGLLALADQAGSRYAYQPQHSKLDQLARAVAELDRTRPVTLIKLISLPPSDGKPADANALKTRCAP